jgi:hypothetical protein
MEHAIPSIQNAIQLIGPDQLKLNAEKPVDAVGQYQILARVEAVGLCFSDLKLLKQFDKHVRKSPILSGIDPAVLSEMPCYRPNMELIAPLWLSAPKSSDTTLASEYLCRPITAGSKPPNPMPRLGTILKAASSSMS